MASRIINDAIQGGLICIYDETVGGKSQNVLITLMRMTILPRPILML
ncbi:hypothetical protein [uncultured Desulfobacter sp.]|nr:hypothetical protein [uncultured Desulfobacter sp.]